MSNERFDEVGTNILLVRTCVITTNSELSIGWGREILPDLRPFLCVPDLTVEGLFQHYDHFQYFWKDRSKELSRFTTIWDDYHACGLNTQKTFLPRSSFCNEMVVNSGESFDRGRPSPLKWS